MSISIEKQAILRTLLEERRIEFAKLEQACQSGAYKAWKKRRKNVDKLNQKLRDLNIENYGNEDLYQH